MNVKASSFLYSLGRGSRDLEKRIMKIDKQYWIKNPSKNGQFRKICITENYDSPMTNHVYEWTSMSMTLRLDYERKSLTLENFGYNWQLRVCALHLLAYYIYSITQCHHVATRVTNVGLTRVNSPPMVSVVNILSYIRVCDTCIMFYWSIILADMPAAVLVEIFLNTCYCTIPNLLHI